MTEPVNRYDEEMRRVLNAAADLVVPAGDGLDRIRERVVHRPVPYAWLLAWAGWLPARLGTGLRVAASAVAVAVADTRASLAEPASGGGARSRAGSAWLRPTVAAVGALAIVAIGAAIALPRLNQNVQSTGFSRSPGSSVGASVAPGGTSPSSSADGRATPVSPHQSPKVWRSPLFRAAPAFPETCPPTPSPSPDPSSSSPTPAPSGQISPTPAPNPTETSSAGPPPIGTTSAESRAMQGTASGNFALSPDQVAGAAAAETDCSGTGSSSAPTTQPTAQGTPTPTPVGTGTPTSSPSPSGSSSPSGTPTPTGESSATPTPPTAAPPPDGS